MNTTFKMCADCVNKRFIGTEPDGRKIYYCSLVDGIIRKGLVYDSTDASVCIKWGIFKDRK